MIDIKRSWVVYLVTGLMLVVALVSGAFALVWCGSFFFLFSGWQGVVLLLITALIAWRAGTAARDAWQGYTSAPPSAIAALFILQILILIIQVEAFITGRMRGITFTTLIPHIILLGLIGLVFWLSPHFSRHLIEADAGLRPEPIEPEVDEDEQDYLGGA